MPPRLLNFRALKPLTTPSTSIASFLVPFIQVRTLPNARYASILSSLSDVPASYNKRIRRGRGPSSGKGKTSGRGHKGQKQHGKVPAGFNGGQTKDEVVAGKRGFDNQFSVDMSPINLDRIQSWIDQGRLDIRKPITIKELQESRCLHGVKDGVKLLARNSESLRSPINITVSRASAAAIAAIESLGGSVQTRYYTKASIKRVLRNESHPTLSLLSPPSSTASDFPSSSMLEQISTYRYRLPDPSSRKEFEYYRDPAHRGYLAYQVKDGEGPSLFFKTPRELQTGTSVARKRPGKTAAAKTERIW